MAAVTQVGITNGVPTSGTGEVMTLNAIAALLPAALAANGGLKVEGMAAMTPLKVSAEGTTATYSASIWALPSAAAATDIFVIPGSATKTVRVRRIAISGIATAAGVIDVLLVRRSTANTGGTSAAASVASHDSGNGGSTVAPVYYTANPGALGADAGKLRAGKLLVSTTAGGGGADRLVWDFGTRNDQGIVLRGAAEVLAINLSGQTVSGGQFNIDAEYTEE